MRELNEYEKWEPYVIGSEDAIQQAMLSDIKRLLEKIDGLEEDLDEATRDAEFWQDEAVYYEHNERDILDQLPDIDQLGYNIAIELRESIPSLWYISNNRILELLAEYKKEYDAYASA